MTKTDLDRIEAALGFPLPAFYCRFMLAYPADLRARQPEWLRPVTEGELADDPEIVIALNRFVRAQEEGYFFDDGPWPDEYLVIGTEYDQNYFAINRLDGKQAVYRWDHADGEMSRIAGSLGGYVRWLIRWWDEIRRDSEP
jgi:hypothetical protein